MSVTVTAVPTMFIAINIFTKLAALATVLATEASVLAAAEAGNSLKNVLEDSNIDDVIKQSLLNKDQDNKNKECIFTQENLKLLTQEYETPFVNSELVVRTLEEYGLKIVENQENLITAKIERVIISFKRENETLPFAMKFIFPDDCDEMQKEIASNIYEEYGSNTQEEVYIQIKENIAKSNMYIEEEEILEDDSIVLTININ